MAKIPKRTDVPAVPCEQKKRPLPHSRCVAALDAICETVSRCGKKAQDEGRTIDVSLLGQTYRLLQEAKIGLGLCKTLLDV